MKARGRVPGVKWEIAEAKLAGKGLVAVMLKPNNQVPVPLRNAGALFVPSRQGAVGRAISIREGRRGTTGDWELR